MTSTTDLDHFNPVEALKTMAVAEVATKYYRRANDPEGLYRAIEVQVSEQRKFVLWWDRQKKGQGERTDIIPRNRSVTKLEDLKLDKMTVSRWRKRFVDPVKYENFLTSVKEKCLRIVVPGTGVTASKWTGEDTWYTPKKYIEAARAVMGGIDLDPASSAFAQKTVKATKYYTKDDSGLDHPWQGRVFLNPPYKMPLIRQFVEKLIAESVGEAILLTNNNTDTTWWHKAMNEAQAVCLTAGRISFYNEEGESSSPTNGQTFFYFGANVDRFSDVFGEKVGLILARIDGNK